ncbi:MAG TPA: hypothetical protein VG841_00390 [Caulobacterales bacterium]|nr:hypothetical protein [Caulobacterales bacterium]
MKSQLQVVLSYRTMTAFDQLPPPTTEAEDAILPLMTINFRMCFWRVFDRVWSIDTGGLVMTVLGLPATFSQAHLFEARALKGAGVSQPDYVFVATFDFDVAEGELARARTQLREQLTSRQFVELYQGMLRPTPAGFLFDRLLSELPGHSSWVGDHSDTVAAHAPYLAAFFHYGWILALRVDRGSILMDLSTREIADNTNTQQILLRRIQLIQLQRYFLTEERSNNKELQGVCARLREKYKLDKRFARLSDLHRAMEEHLDNTFKVLQSKATRTTNLAIQALTFSGLPFAITSVLLSLNLASSIFKDFEHVLVDSRIYVLLGFSFVLTFAIVGIAILLDGMRHRAGD